ncbi:hypothetical protein GS399_19955 [Pedobacter sp. HMF7647]|uniref:Protein BatD n=1 Tax=Hufsiella arboris TaxID=2695275 RepID=A0A7K1YF63_9SPHI|nr:BatD family protein [Hufsiella arboris]MXV53247.1 hypothetical protein [Hufsiella arboris]
MVIKRLILIIFFCRTMACFAQIHCFARAEMDKRSVYVQQPFKVTYTIMTETWFTAPVDWDDLQIPNAFIIPFDRTMPGMFDVNGKQFAGIQFYFIVFPYKPGHFTLPAINIVATTPPVGESVAKKINIKTQQLSYVVKPLPGGSKSSEWLVAKDVAITQSWNRSLKNLKVGDVLKRTIVINARGTLPQFIPELKKDSLDWASAYPGPASLEDTRDEYDANGRRTETVTYLLEKEGNFTFPSVSLRWWNPVAGRMYARGTGVVNIRVGPNPNLGMLKTLKDSLNASQTPAAVAVAKKGPYLIMGIPWYWFLLYTLAFLAIGYLLITMFGRLYRFIRRRYQEYTSSEVYWFRKFEKSSLLLPALLSNLYAWWDRFKPAGSSSSLIRETGVYMDISVDENLEKYYKQAFGSSRREVTGEPSFKKEVGSFRKELRKKEKKSEGVLNENQQMWKC